jgi:threonine aldolase
MHVKGGGTIDLRSDTVTRPTEAMQDAMREASFGDDSRDGDETVRALEALAAERMGKEAAAFMPSGTMTNLVAVLAHTERGGEVLLDAGAHILNSELGGIASVAGAFYKGIPGHRGAMDLDHLADAARKPGREAFGTALVAMETSHNRAGGAVLPLAHMAAVYRMASARGVPVHTDGARIFNAATALGTDARALAAHTDSICFCVSKGLSAPVGSLLCGSAVFIDRARAFRRMVGGNMRQSGPLAAAGIVALDTMVARLREDHATAQRLAHGFAAIDPRLVDPTEVETNIVKLELPRARGTAAQWSAALSDAGVRVNPCERHALRFVTHRHILEADVDETLSVFGTLWRASASRRESPQHH